MTEHYVYALLDTRKPGPFIYKGLKFVFDYEPFYVGKGKRNRVDKHFSNAYDKTSPRYNSLKCKKIRNIKRATGEIYEHVKIQEGLTEQNAYDLEIKLIAMLGRLDSGTGILTNETNGGEGFNGIFYDDDKREASSLRFKAMWESFTEEQKQAIADKIQETRENWTPKQREAVRVNKSTATSKQLASETQEQKAKRSLTYATTCANRTQEQRAELSATLSGSRKRFFDSLTDEEYYEFHKQVYEKSLATRANWTEEERKDLLGRMSASMQEHWDSLSDEGREIHRQRTSSGLRNMSAEAKRKRNANISTGLNLFFESESETHKAKRIAKAEETWASKSEEERYKHGQKESHTKSNWSDEQKAIVSKNCSTGQKEYFANAPKDKLERRRANSQKGVQNFYDNRTDEQVEAKHKSAVLTHANLSEKQKVERSTAIAAGKANSSGYTKCMFGIKTGVPYMFEKLVEDGVISQEQADISMPKTLQLAEAYYGKPENQDRETKDWLYEMRHKLVDKYGRAQDKAIYNGRSDKTAYNYVNTQRSKVN